MTFFNRNIHNNMGTSSGNGDIGLEPLRKPFFIDTYKSPTYK